MDSCALIKDSQLLFMRGHNIKNFDLTLTLTNSVTPCNTVPSEELTFPQPLKKLPEVQFSATQEIIRNLRNLKVRYRVHRNPSLVPILNQINPVHPTSSNFFKIHYNIILQSEPRSYTWSLSFRFPHKTL